MEKIADVIDRIEMLISAMQLQMPCEIHLKALKESLSDIHEELRRAYLDAGGENVWDN